MVGIYLKNKIIDIIYIMQTNENYLNINAPAVIDDCVIMDEEAMFEPVNTNTFNTVGSEIVINIQNADSYYRPSESRLVIEGDLVKLADGTRYANNDRIGFTHNGPMLLFSLFQYQLNGNNIETVQNPGHASLIKGMASYSDDYSKSSGLNMFWLKDTNVGSTDAIIDSNTGFIARKDLLLGNATITSGNVGRFSVSIPLSHIFGFCEDYDKVLYGCKHTLRMLRASDSSAIFRSTGTNPGDGKINIKRIAWYIPQIRPSISHEQTLLNMINNKQSIDVTFRSRQFDSTAVPVALSFSWRLSIQTGTEKPRWILLAFNSPDATQGSNDALYLHSNLTNAYVTINSADNRYPRIDITTSFSDNVINNAYYKFSEFQKKYYGFDKITTGSQVTPLEYRAMYPIFVFDIRKQSERLKESVSDITIKTTFSANPAANTMAYALVLSDRLLKLQSDGNKFSVIYN